MVIRHYVDDVPAAVDRAIVAGAELLAGPLRGDLGTPAAYLKGPRQPLVHVCRDI